MLVNLYKLYLKIKSNIENMRICSIYKKQIFFSNYLLADIFVRLFHSCVFIWNTHMQITEITTFKKQLSPNRENVVTSPGEEKLE